MFKKIKQPGGQTVTIVFPSVTLSLPAWLWAMRCRQAQHDLYKHQNTEMLSPEMKY